MVGGRFLGRWNQRWGYRLRADYAGGGTEGGFNALATVNYTFGQTGGFTVDGGYRYLDLEVADNLSIGASTESDINFSGPLLGFVFNF